MVRWTSTPASANACHQSLGSSRSLQPSNRAPARQAFSIAAAHRRSPRLTRAFEQAALDVVALQLTERIRSRLRRRDSWASRKYSRVCMAFHW